MDTSKVDEDRAAYRRWSWQARCLCRSGQENWPWEFGKWKPEAMADLQGYLLDERPRSPALSSTG